MLRRRSVQAVAATAAAPTRHRSSSQLWITVHCGGAPLAPTSRLSSTACGLHHYGGSGGTSHGHAVVLRVPLDPVLTTDARAAHLAAGLQPTRVLLAPHGAARHGHHAAAAPAGDADEEDPRGPYEVTVDEVLLPAARGGGGGGAAAVHTVADLVQLLVDPDLASSVEPVSLRDFASMTEKRKLKAVRGDAECLDVLLRSERFQSEQDARALRLMGVATVGQWKEQPDRVQLSAYGRGVLDTAYHRLARHRQHSQRDEVVAWLTRAIQRAVADELMAPKRLSDGTGGLAAPPATPPFLIDLKASAVSAAAAAEAAADAARAPTATTAARPAPSLRAAASAAEARGPDEGEEAEEVEEEEDEEEGVTTVTSAGGAGGGSGSAAPQRRAGPHAPRTTAATAAPPRGEGRRDEVEDAEMAKLMAEAEAILGREGAKEEEVEEGEEEEEPPVPEKTKRASASAAAAPPRPPPAPLKGTPATPRASPAARAAPPHAATAVTAQAQEDEAAGEADEAEEDEEELVEEEIEEEEEEQEEGADPLLAPVASGSAAAPPTHTGDAAAAAAAQAAAAPAEATAEERREKLVRLAELMMKQFNTADGYLHPTNKAERTLQEQRGDIIVLDEDTAQVDPLAMFSAYHAATVTEADPVGVRALKTIWTSYNKHQMALEEATSDAAVEFYKRESVNALLYGSVLMRALAREEPVVVLEGTPLPPYGFPLVSSDTRPFSEATASGSSSGGGGATDMSPGKVPTAMQAYKTLFNTKEKRYSPFRPAVDQSAGCSVVRLSGTTLHLYYTSTKDHIMEEEVRLPFAEVMLGMLHLLRHKVLPRINVVHYHLIATKLADPENNTDFMLRSTATIDLTNPFTKEEVVRLRALAVPLGMADEMDEYRCIDDLVMEIEETSGASVVHSLLHNREDLEATLTATLAQLLPEDGSDGNANASGDAAEAAVGSDGRAAAADDEGGRVEEEEEVEEEADALAAVPAPSRKQRAAAPAAPAAARGSAKRRAVEEVDAEDAEDGVLRVEEDAEDALATLPSPPQQRAKLPQPALPTAPTTRRAAAPAPASAAARHTKASASPEGGADEAEDEEEEGEGEGELEEALYSQWQKQKTHQQQQQQRTAKGATPGKPVPAAPARRRNGGSTADVDALGDEAGAAEEVEEAEGFEEDEELGEEEEIEEEEEEEVVAAARTPASPPPPPPAAATPSVRAAPAASPAAKASGRGTTSASRRGKPFTPQEVDSFEEDEEEELEVIAAPVLPRAAAGRRAVPVAAAAAAAAPVASSPAPPAAAAPRRAAVQEELEDGDADAAGVTQVRTRRAAGRRPTGRSRATPPADEGVAVYAAEPPVASDAAAGEGEDDQWFRKRPKRRYFK